MLNRGLGSFTKVPVPRDKPFGTVSRDQHIQMLEEKLRDYKAENHLLGRILQDFKEERGSVENQLEEAKRSEQVHRMKVDQLASDLGMAQRTIREKTAHVEDLNLTKLKLEDALARAQDDIQRGKELELELKERRAAEAALLRREADAKELAGLAEEKLAQARRHEFESDRALRDLSEQLEAAEQKGTEFEATKDAWKKEWDRVKAGHRSQVGELEERVKRLEGEVQEAQRWREECAVLRVERDEALRRAHDAERRAQEVRRATDGERGDEMAAAAEVQRLRAQIVAMAERADQAATQAEGMAADRSALADQLAAAEEALTAARQEIFELRAREIAAKDDTTASIIRAFADASTSASLADPAPSAAHRSLVQYSKVLQHTVKELQEGQAALTHQLHEAQYLEMQARRLLADARAKEVAAQRALEGQARRVQTLERMRMGDLKELHDLEGRVAAVTQEAWFLRDALAHERAKVHPAGPTHPAPAPTTTAALVPASAAGPGLGHDAPAHLNVSSASAADYYDALARKSSSTATAAGKPTPPPPPPGPPAPAANGSWSEFLRASAEFTGSQLPLELSPSPGGKMRGGGRALPQATVSALRRAGF